MDFSKRKLLSGLGAISIISLSGCAGIDNIARLADDSLSTRAGFGEEIQYDKLEITADYMLLDEVDILVGISQEEKTLMAPVGGTLLIPYFDIVNTGNTEYGPVTLSLTYRGELPEEKSRITNEYADDFEYNVFPIDGLPMIPPNSSRRGYRRKVYEIPSGFDETELKMVLSIPGVGDDGTENLQWSE